MIKSILQLMFVFIVIISALETSDYRILEDLAFTNATSYDLIELEEDGEVLQKLRIVNSVPEAEPEAEVAREVFEAVGLSSKEARSIMARQSERIIVSGQLRTVLFGLQMAQSGIWRHIDTLVRDPSIGQRVRVVVVEGDAGELLKQEYPSITDTGTFVYELLSKESQHNVIPEVSLYHFVRDYFDDGTDAVAPILKHGAESISAEGVAVFQDDRYVGKIAPEQTLIFGILREALKGGDLGVALSEDEFALLSAIETERKVQIQRGTTSRSFTATFDVEVVGGLLEYIGSKDLRNESEFIQLQREIADAIEEQSEELIKQVQGFGSDCIGIGRYVRNSLSAAEWYNLDWNSVYPNVKIEVNAKVKIKNIGNIL